MSAHDCYVGIAPCGHIRAWVSFQSPRRDLEASVAGYIRDGLRVESRVTEDVRAAFGECCERCARTHQDRNNAGGTPMSDTPHEDRGCARCGSSGGTLLDIGTGSTCHAEPYQCIHWLQVDNAALRADNERLRREVEALRQGLWDCFRVAGGDTDGDPTPRAITSPLVPLVLDCVTDLRNGYDELLDDDS